LLKTALKPERIRVELYAELRRLARDPGIGHYHEELLNRKFRFWNVNRYVIVYAWEPKPIQVIAIVHGARDLAVFLSHRTEPEP
jgi:plasmid stabilization system protein ParE